MQNRQHRLLLTSQFNLTIHKENKQFQHIMMILNNGYNSAMNAEKIVIIIE